MKPLSEIYFDLQQRTEQTVDRSRTDRLPMKIKTRGVDVQGDPSADHIPPKVQLDQQPTIVVDARALEVFRTLFYTPSISAVPGELAWTEFLHAMDSAGFLIEKFYGSVWQFQPTKLDVQRGIQFHEPYSSGKLAYWVARRFGRRLERAYGLLGQMFVVQENGREKVKGSV
ncbi:hypothetical protein LTR56_023069 [Elasticomyces elasticus]|nr:hypothetical protein LTR56_023069 [Elasticomyces elasticus]KAK3623346.1 hypothetical protein LTR22_024425 [Elasticomyces elasticus]KAK4907292.1 hypothetical protein LTR49_023662 [Elasticomyces elasticus]KAK5747770.1 hypothetical protein LTS12_022169 [Elasticomyces elasticus]